MADVALSTLLPRLIPELPKCPQPIITQMLRRVTRDFFHETGVWNEDLATVASVADQKNYTLVNPYATTDIWQVNSVKVGDETEPEDMRDYLYDYDRRTGVLRLNSAVTEDDEDILFHVTFLPKHTISELPEVLAPLYDEAIVLGVLYRLKMQSGKPWYDPRLGKDYQELYEGEIADAIGDDIIGGDSGEITMEVGYVF